MANGHDKHELVRVRNEILVALRMIYPAALQAGQILRSLLSVFPMLEWNHLKRDIHYLVEKGYLQRVVASSEQDEPSTPWRNRWFRVTAAGMEVADRIINDPALDS